MTQLPLHGVGNFVLQFSIYFHFKKHFQLFSLHLALVFMPNVHTLCWSFFNACWLTGHFEGSDKESLGTTSLAKCTFCRALFWYRLDDLAHIALFSILSLVIQKYFAYKLKLFPWCHFLFCVNTGYPGKWFYKRTKYKHKYQYDCH